MWKEDRRQKFRRGMTSTVCHVSIRLMNAEPGLFFVVGVVVHRVKTEDKVQAAAAAALWPINDPFPQPASTRYWTVQYDY